MVSTAARVGSINVLLAVQFGQATTGLNTFAGAVERTGQRTQRAVGGIDRSVMSMNRTLGGIGASSSGFRGLTISALRTRDSIGQLNNMLLATSALMGGLIPTLSGAYFLRMADRAHLLSNNLKTVTNSTAELTATQDALFAVAQRTRSSFESTATIYARTARATEHLGKSQAELLRMTETIQKAFAIGGASTAEAQGAAIQLSQGIASDRLGGEEYRSVAENAPVLLRGIADSLGVNIGKLREMAHAGELTAEVVTQAIIDASQRIDEEFSKTTSTIGQAMVKLDNAILKYVGDSENVSVASAGIVTAINAISANIDTTADALLLLGGTALSVFGGRSLNAIRNNTMALGAQRAMAAQAAKANMDLATATAAATRSEWVQQRLAFNQALKDGNLTEKQVERQRKSLEATTRRYRDSVAAAALATREHDAALRAASISGRTFATVGRAASAAWAFIGGPFGAALLALGGIMYLVQKSSADAQAMADEYAEAIKKAGEESNGAAGGIRRASEELTMAANAAGAAAANVSLATAQSQFETSIERMRLLAQGLRSALDVAIGFNSVSFSPLSAEVQKLINRFEAGDISAEELRAELDRLAREDPDNSAILSRLQEIGDGADAARGKIDGLRTSMQEALGELGQIYADFYDGKGDRVGTGPFGGGGSDTQDTINLARRMNPELFDDLDDDEKKSSRARHRRSADDRFDNSVQSIYDRIEALRLEREMLGASFYEQTRREEALRLEQEALKQAREEARRKGEVDWQNAQISAAKRAEIEKVSAALAAEADATRRATEAMEFNRYLLKDVMSGMREALDDGKITWEEVGDVAIRVLDKIIGKIEDELIDAIFRMNNAGGSGGGGLFGFLGSLLGIGGGASLSPAAWNVVSSGRMTGLFDSGGVHLGSSIVPFGPKTKAIGNGVIADSGLGSRHFPAVLEYGETVLAESMADRTMGVVNGLASAMQGMKSGGGGEGRSVLEVQLSPDLLAQVLSQAKDQAITVVRGNNRARQNLYQNGGEPR